MHELIKLPQVSPSTAMIEPFVAVTGLVNFTPLAERHKDTFRYPAIGSRRPFAYDPVVTRTDTA